MSWRRLTVVWIGIFSFLFSFFLLIPVLPLFARDLGLSEAQIGVALAAFAISSMLMRPWAGWATDRFGRRPLMLAGGIVFVLAPLSYSLSAGLVSLTMARLFHGAGMGLYPTAATAMAADLAPAERRAEVMGVFGMAGALALALGPMTGVTLAGMAGLPGLFVIASLVGALGFALTTIVLETVPARSAAPFSLEATLSRAVLFPSFLELCLMLTYGALITFLPLHADRQGLNPGVFFFVYALSLTIVRQPAGRLSDRYGRPGMVVVSMLLLTAALLIVALSRGPASLIAGGIVYGIGQGIGQPAMVAWCVDQVGPTERGRAMGTFHTALELGIAVGAMIAGVTVTQVGFAATFIAAATVTLGAGALAATRLNRANA